MAASKSSLQPLALVAGIGLFAAVFWPALPGPFLFDDYANIADNPALKRAAGDPAQIWPAAWSSASGPLGRPLAMLSFALNAYLTGLDPLPLRLVNGTIHIANAILLFVLLRLLLTHLRDTGRFPHAPLPTAILVSLLWIAHPLTVGTAAYIVQRMALLAAFFTLAALLAYSAGRLRQIHGRTGWPFLLATIPLAVAGILSKESAALVIAYALLIEALIFRCNAHTATKTRIIRTAFITVVVICVIGAVSAFFLLDLPKGYATRPFTLYERLLTEARALIWYAAQTWLPVPSELGLFHDDFRISRGLLDPPSTALAIAAIAIAIAAAIALRHTHPAASFGILFFFSSHLLESTVIPLELVFEHRNYLGAAGLLLGSVYGVLSLPTRQRVHTALLAAFLAYYAFAAHIYMTSWGSHASFAVAAVMHHPNSPRANMEAAGLYAHIAYGSPEKRDQYWPKAQQLLTRAHELAPRDPNPLLYRFLLGKFLNSPLEDPLWEKLRRLLRDAPLNLTTVNLLISTLWCEIDGKCPATPTTTDARSPLALARDALSNPTLPPRTAALLLRHMAAYSATVRARPTAAVALLERALRLTPSDPALMIELATLKMAVGDYGQAAQLITTAAQQDRLGRFGHTIRALQEVLSEHNRNTVLPSRRVD